jgi:hypothetical protein
MSSEILVTELRENLIDKTIGNDFAEFCKCHRQAEGYSELIPLIHTWPISSQLSCTSARSWSATWDARRCSALFGPVFSMSSSIHGLLISRGSRRTAKCSRKPVRWTRPGGAQRHPRTQGRDRCSYEGGRSSKCTPEFGPGHGNFFLI